MNAKPVNADSLFGGNHVLPNADVHERRLDKLPLDQAVTIGADSGRFRDRDVTTTVTFPLEITELQKKIKTVQTAAPPSARWNLRIAQADIDNCCPGNFEDVANCFFLPKTFATYASETITSKREMHRPTFFGLLLSRAPKCIRSTRRPIAELKEADGIGYCNITKSSPKVWPENITISATRFSTEGAVCDKF